jgi:hypothetical protein
MGYIGSKAGAGVFHAIIAETPPHSVYVEPFFRLGRDLPQKKARRIIHRD